MFYLTNNSYVTITPWTRPGRTQCWQIAADLQGVNPICLQGLKTCLRAEPSDKIINFIEYNIN